MNRVSASFHARCTAGALLHLLVAAGACGGPVTPSGTGGSSSGTTTTTTSATTTSATTTSSGTGGVMPPASSDKVDLLVMVDNSRGMADKQLLLALALPDLVGGLVNPRCVDAQGQPGATQPAGPLEPCPAGTSRELSPVTDLHVGVVDSSLGGHGSDSCDPSETQSCSPAANPSNNDAGHLLSRVDACGGQNVPTYQNAGFLAWDPAQKLMPPGAKDLGAIKVGDLSQVDPHQQVVTDTPGLVATLKDMVLGAGQVGCGYESQLESWYRFLVDPEPYETISLQAGKAVPAGIDDVLLKQRADFLRPSSLLLVVLLSDENDCSVKEYGQFFYAVQQHTLGDPAKSFHLPRARKECETNPNGICCKSCGQNPDSCPLDDGCAQSPTLTTLEDSVNLRCFDQKRRFGIDFLYPIDRYTNGLTGQWVPNRQGDLIQNPLFMDLDPNDQDSKIRSPGLVLLAGIVGVPWQGVARDPADLAKGFKTAEELGAPGPNGDTTWDAILGDPIHDVAPKDPHMIESIHARPGLPPPSSLPDADPVSGHEYSVPQNDDLQYACVFNLPAPRDCSANMVSCDCSNPANDNPLCDPSTKTIQNRAKGYPGLRELSLLKSLGVQGVVGSVCAAQTSNPAAADFGYRPAVRAILDRVKGHLPP